jgi:two-component system phosphate regulon sensor histidine kinase PhoR
MGPLFKDLPPIRLSPGEGIAGHVAETGEPLIVNDAYSDERWYARADAISGFETNSILCVPLLVENRVMGVLEAINKRDGIFDRQDLMLLQAIAGPLAAAIENSRLHLDVLTEKRRIETMFASMSEGLLVIDRDMHITVINEALGALLQRAEGELVGRRVQDVITLEGDKFASFVDTVFAREELYPQIAADIVTEQDRLVPVLVSGTCIEDDAGNINEALFVFSDLSLIREFERMRDDFFHNIVHELRTPLATILMYARLLRVGKAADDPEKTDRFLGFIERESNRLQLMVRQMLQLAKLEAREIQRSSAEVDLNRLFDEILPPLADRATEKGLVFAQKIEPELPLMIGNEETMYIIVKNLVENAIKFTMSGGVRVSAKSHANGIEVIVADDGIGIPEAALPNLFKRFYRASTAVERGIAGTGLGLYMVKEGIGKHGGTVDVSSVEGKGTTFTIHLPVAN